MQDLIFHINKQSLTVEKYHDEIVANSVNYLHAIFVFDDYENSDWKDCKKLHAEFTWSGHNKWAEISNNERIAVPWEVIKAPGFTVNVFGTDYEGAYVDKQIRKRITTRPIPIIVKQSGDINGVPGAPFSDEINILIMVDEAHTYSEKALRLATQCEQRVDELEDLVHRAEVFVGGVNLLNNSRNIELFSNIPEKYPISRAIITEKNRIFHRYRRINPNQNLGVLSFYNTIPYSDFTEDISGKMVTFSFLARAQREQMASLMAYMSDPDGGIERLDFSPVTETFLLTTEWKRFSFVVKIDQKITNTAIFRFCPFDIFVSDEVNPRTFYLDICEWKVEHGNIATDWTPSLVETDQQITEVKTSLREEFGKIISEVEGTVETLDGKIVETNKQIQTLESTTSIIKSETYGANILENSGFHSDGDKWEGYTNGALDFSTQSAKILYKGKSILGQSVLGKIESGETYTVSIKVKVVKPSSTGKLQILDDGKYQGSWYGQGSKTIPISAAYDWTTFQFTYTPDKRVDVSDRYHMIITWNELSADCEIYFKEFKLEKGEWATAWSDNPEDNARHFLELTQTAKDLTAKLGYIEDGNTDYLQFSEEGLIIGDWTSGNILGANVRIYTEKGSAGVQIRDGDKILANFKDSEIFLGEKGLVISSKELVIIPGINMGFITIPEVKLPFNYIESPTALQIVAGGTFILSNTLLDSNKVENFCSITGSTEIDLPFSMERKLGKHTGGVYTYAENLENGQQRTIQVLRSCRKNENSFIYDADILFTTGEYDTYEVADSKIKLDGHKIDLVQTLTPGLSDNNLFWLSGLRLSGDKVKLLTTKKVGYQDNETPEFVETSIHYKQGDNVTLRWTGSGYITSDKTVVHFCIPISKIIPNGLTPSAQGTTIKIRQADGYKFGSSSSTYVAVMDDNVSVSLDKTDGNYIRVAVTLSKDNTVINNDACGIDVYTTISF